VSFEFHEDPWPPPGYYSGGAFGGPRGAPLRICSPLEDRIRKAPDGTRHLSYQLPIMPVDTNRPIFISGDIRVDDDLTTLLNFSDKPVGTIDVTTGIFDLDIDKAPGANTRFVEYFSNGTLVVQPPDADPNSPTTFQG